MSSIHLYSSRPISFSGRPLRPGERPDDRADPAEVTADIHTPEKRAPKAIAPGGQPSPAGPVTGKKSDEVSGKGVLIGLGALGAVLAIVGLILSPNKKNEPEPLPNQSTDLRQAFPFSPSLPSDFRSTPSTHTEQYDAGTQPQTVINPPLAPAPITQMLVEAQDAGSLSPIQDASLANVESDASSLATDSNIETNTNGSTASINSDDAGAPTISVSNRPTIRRPRRSYLYPASMVFGSPSSTDAGTSPTPPRGYRRATVRDGCRNDAIIFVPDDSTHH